MLEKQAFILSLAAGTPSWLFCSGRAYASMPFR
jgi:hypothetical protein